MTQDDSVRRRWRPAVPIMIRENGTDRAATQLQRA
jgi:hypothetical protein